MTEKLQIYKCDICGNIVQVLIPSYGELVCCNQPMKLLEIQHDETEIGEKHAPKKEIRDNRTFVHVKTHPMLPEHYIQFIEIYPEDKSELHLKYFDPGEIPEYEITNFIDSTKAIELCNIHGLWGEDKND